MTEIHHLGSFKKLKIKLADWQTRDDKWKLYVGGGTVALLIVAAVVWAGTSAVRKKIAANKGKLSPVPTLSVGQVAEPKT